MTRHLAVPGLQAAGYRRHALHDEARTWVEKNCYVDVWIEVLHALGLDPAAMLGACAAIDFAGDGFTFFKPSHDELRELYGVQVHELNVWLPLVEHAERHLAAAELIASEVDSFWLPDTAGTDYRRNHVKTTIVLADLDVAARRLGYFHNAGYFELAGDDFTGLFRLDAPPDKGFLPLYAELLRVDHVVRLPRAELARQARTLLERHVARRPRQNPITRFGLCLGRDLATAAQRGPSWFHAWAFATVRQLGACLELLAFHLRWLEAAGDGEGLDAAAVEFECAAGGAKTLILKAARAANQGRPLDGELAVRDIAAAWERGMRELARALTPLPASGPA